MLFVLNVISPSLGIFSDFFTWINNLFVGIYNFILNIIHGIVSVWQFTLQFYELLTVPLGYLPAILIAVALTTIIGGMLRSII